MKKILISTGILILVIVLAFYLKSVLGSGGSFTKTEHGGTDVNTNSTTGVYRSSVDKTATGHPAAAGECVHCHEVVSGHGVPLAIAVQAAAGLIVD